MAKKINALLPVARWAVISLAAGILVISIIGIIRFPDYAARHLDLFRPNDFWTSSQAQQGFARLGWSPLFGAWFEAGRSLAGLLLIYSISVAILLKKSDDWFGLLLTAILVILSPISGAFFKPVIELWPGLEVFSQASGQISWQLFFLIFFFFPDGRPVPSWSGWFSAAYAIFILAGLFVEPLNRTPYSTIAGTGMVVLAIGSQVYRYTRRSDALRRQQTRWVVSVLTCFLLLMPFIFLFGFKPPVGDLGLALIKDYSFSFLASLVFELVPVAIAIAVLRYHLWDLDILIRRTLAYGVITAILALVYLGGVTLFQQILTTLTGQKSPVAVVLSTLLTVILFTPLRQRVQGMIDRRFFRQKYDAARTLAEFSAVASREVELEALSSRLAIAAQEALQPETVSLWLKK